MDSTNNDKINTSQSNATDPQASGRMPLAAGVDIDVPAPKEENIDDVEIEAYNDDALSGESLTPKEQMHRLRDKLRECVKEKQAYLDGWQRSKADFVNYKKREAENKGEFLKFAREELITDLLPVLESFHMAFANKEAWGKVDESWRRGVEHIHTQLTQVLEGHGVTALDPLGKDFDPNEHTAIGTITTEDALKHHKVAEVLQLGYRLNGKLIRSPRVKIYGEMADATSEAEKQ
ncbi:MAG: nucleotide exchange factor GrpE [Candidatus Lloydbacteria bacterium RIFCSPHIGHO2_02_FULL_50_13]|uniref:Protein GrpE n=1 Tax=Candidatus Lloydbacteria bacterium RIFCSPHIGHO2_02_FULL_50_13 TaxID=1798661 RepID=A0A1G2D1M4_9BACT|nr:MAG: nucleotide exchange factor GrpE [Candidatus Lloydbacteria bacterium RIFCSPHIGHO2_02_FULL_50_13]